MSVKHARALVLLSLASLPACEGAPPPHSPPRTVPDIAALAQSIEPLRRALGVAPYRATLSVQVRNPITHAMEGGRGMIAVAPGEAMRMVLLGPAGATTLDAWVTLTRYRFEVPPLDSLRRGGFDGTEDARLPLGFFRWWFLSPFDGRILGFDAAASRYFFEDERAKEEVVAVSQSRQLQLFATRFSFGGHVEAVHYTGGGDGNGESHAEYIDYATGLRVVVTIGERQPQLGRCVFADPDGPPCEEKSE